MVSFVLRVLFRIQLGKPPLFSLFSLDYSSFTVTFDVLDHSVVISEAWISSGSKFKLPRRRIFVRTWDVKMKGTCLVWFGFFPCGGFYTEMVS